MKDEEGMPLDFEGSRLQGKFPPSPSGWMIIAVLLVAALIISAFIVLGSISVPDVPCNIRSWSGC